MNGRREHQGLTPLGKLATAGLVLGLLGGGAYLLLGERALAPMSAPKPGPASATPAPAAPAPVGQGLDTHELVETKTSVPRLAPAQAYVVRDRTVDIELSQYAGYAGLVVANGGLLPSESSSFFQKHGFKVKIAISEEESWSALNSGKMAASATTVDVLAVYGRQLQVVVPAQIGFSRGADGVVVRKDVRRINDLKGQVLLASQFTEADFFIRFLAQEAGIGVSTPTGLDAALDPARINLVYCADAFAAGDLFLRALRAGAARPVGAVTWAPKTTEVVAASQGQASLLATNRNVLVVADVLIVNRGFAAAEPKIVAGLVEGLIEGNRLVRENPEPHLDVIAKAFGWERAEAKDELGKVHLSNLPESLAFFGGTIASAGSFSGIFQSAVLAYGDIVRDPVDGESFLDLGHLRALEKTGRYAADTIAIAPVRTTHHEPLEQNPLLSRNIRFLFKPNSHDLDLDSADNQRDLEAIRGLLQVSPGSTVLLRGHVDGAQIPEFRKKGGEAFVREMALQAMDLSRKRALEIQRLLVDLKRADKARIQIVARGWEEPAGESSDDNRRVEVQWFTLE